MTQILQFIGDILGLVIDFQFSRDRKKRRQFEKENNLPKKLMIHPYIKIVFYTILIGTLIGIIIISYQHFYSNNKNTLKKLSHLEALILDNKNVNGFFPETLQDVIRNNPLRKNICVDSWGNEFIYEVSKDEQKFLLISKGKDGLINTKDDLKAHNK
jgi:hypothetical protein